MTQGPEPKPIRTGATLHTLCVTDGDLSTYKLFARAYGGKTDGDLNHVHENTATMQKWVNLYDIMLDSFKGKGHCVTMDSAFMGDTMAQIGRYVWQINMVGTAAHNRTGANTAEEKKNMKVGTYESVMWQHDDLPLCFAIWSDNNIVSTLSNYHSPEVIADGVMRKQKVDGVRAREQTPVDCPVQNKDYSETFHLIDKGNGTEAKYDIGMESHTHGWSPKLCFRYFNMTLNNAYRIYKWLVKRYTPHRRSYSMPDCIEEAAHAFLQRGESMRTYRPVHPDPVRDLTCVWDTGSGRKLRTDAKGDVVTYTCATTTTVYDQYLSLRKKQKKNPWRTHQSVRVQPRGKCAYNKCPAYLHSNAKRKRGYNTFMKCEECSAKKGTAVYFCNDVKDGKEIRCHLRYHSEHFCRETNEE
ncbi:hypothetical protein ACHAWF_001263 [Thalassiosira exigua]